MTLQSSSRKYGSVEDLSRSRTTTAAASASEDKRNSSVDRGSFDFDPSLALRRERDHNGEGRRWFSLVVVGVLAVGVMLGLTHAGYRLPKITRNSDSGTTPSMMDVSDPVTPTTTTTTATAEVITSKAVREITPTTADISVAKPPSRQQSVSHTADTAASVQHPPQLSPRTPVSPRTSHSPPQEDVEELPSLSFTALNFYHERDGKPAQDYPWLKDVKLIEPHRETTLAVEAPREGFGYRWKVYHGVIEAGDEVTQASGATAVVSLSELDEHVVVLEETDSDGKPTRRLVEQVMVKYVRREIRTLTDDEREELLDAVSGVM